MKPKILVTGGLGFIGSHTVVALINAGFEPIIVDNLSNSKFFILDRIEKICGIRPTFFQADVCDALAMKKIITMHKDIAVVIHFAAYKAVGESVQLPLKYFHNNLYSLVNLLVCMEEYKINKLVFSSSATVYGQSDKLPLREETASQKALSAYGSTKIMGEEILEKTTVAGKIVAIALRYFNPVGAHESAQIGELPIGVPNNLMPYIAQTAIGKLKELVVYGNDYNTPDGTCIRDYIHVVDLADAHVKACARMLQQSNVPYEVFNIGTGKGNSVLEVIQTFEKINGVAVNYKIGARREGDAEQCYAAVSKANAVLGWRAKLNLEDMVYASWKWEQQLKVDAIPV